MVEQNYMSVDKKYLKKLVDKMTYGPTLCIKLVGCL